MIKATLCGTQSCIDSETRLPAPPGNTDPVSQKGPQVNFNGKYILKNAPAVTPAEFYSEEDKHFKLNFHTWTQNQNHDDPETTSK